MSPEDFTTLVQQYELTTPIEDQANDMLIILSRYKDIRDAQLKSEGTLRLPTELLRALWERKDDMIFVD